MTNGDKKQPAERSRFRLGLAGARFARIRKQVPPLGRLVGGLEQGAFSAVAGMLAWASTQALGLREGFWAAITAVAVAQTELNAATTTARDQFTGAAVGGSVATAVALLVGIGPLGFALAVVIAITGCWLLNAASAARLAGITAVIIFLVPHSTSPARMMLSRVGEVGWGVLMAITVVGIASTVRNRMRRKTA